MIHYLVYFFTKKVIKDHHVEPIAFQGFTSKAEAYEFVERTHREHPSWICYIYKWDLDDVKVY